MSQFLLFRSVDVIAEASVQSSTICLNLDKANEK